MFENFFDLSQPVGFDEVLVSAVVIIFAMGIGFVLLKHKARD